MSSYESEEEEDECRICRGPAEPGRELFRPCKCSGSIGLCHQDCLRSWLEVTRGSGRCELCSYRFRFAPRYAPGTPPALPPREVAFRILRRLAARWLPRAVRGVSAALLWTVVLPVATAYIYHGWMIRPSAVAGRWGREQLGKDAACGAVMAIMIVVSFLSLMSFAEFLRFQWGGVRNDGNNNNRRAPARNDRAVVVAEGDVDEIVVRHDDDDGDGRARCDSPPRRKFGFVGEFDGGGDPARAPTGDVVVGTNDVGEDIFRNNSGRRRGVDAPADGADGADFAIRRPDPPEDVGEADGGGFPVEDIDVPHRMDDDAALEEFMRDQEDGQHDDEELPPLQADRDPPAGDPNRADARFGIRRAFDGVGNNDNGNFNDIDINANGGRDDNAPQMGAEVDEIEVNIALDELLGLRGPILGVVRNLIWLLVFNTAYVGVFAFLPSKLGDAIYHLFGEFAKIEEAVYRIPVLGYIAEGIKATSSRLVERNKEADLVYKPCQLAKIALGYLFVSFSVFIVRGTMRVILRLVYLWRHAGDSAGTREDSGVREDAGDMEFAIRDPARRREEVEEARMADDGSLHGAIENACAIVKVVVLLFIKMLILPLLLGVWLDLATLPLFERTWNDRIDDAGNDLFGSVLLHWVAGITFMLLVTVSVLQLREVAHPAVLASVVRPQEPQPDLLGNLLQEGGTTHARRVLLSLGIYAALLGIHIWFPSWLLLRYDLGKHLPLFRPRFWHVVMPRVQIPVELFAFHICMLGVLERYKNNIGAVQHHWLRFMGGYLGITRQILPHEVSGFKFLGALPVFTRDATENQLEYSPALGARDVIDEDLFGERNGDVFPLWNAISEARHVERRQEIIRAIIASSSCFADSHLGPQTTGKIVYGTVSRDGRRLLKSHICIRLPTSTSTSVTGAKGRSRGDRRGAAGAGRLIPTVVGPYRLKQGRMERKKEGNGGRKTKRVTCIEIWKEVQGRPIPRPPEGWDDLGIGGAERHGRWAWGDEELSSIENGVAARLPFLVDPNASRLSRSVALLRLSAKAVFLLVASWVAITAVLIASLNGPLWCGRFSLYLMRVPDKRVHDPFAFALGLLVLTPGVLTCARLVSASSDGPGGVPSLVTRWIRTSFRPGHFLGGGGRKESTLVTFLLLWLFVCPLLLGNLYCQFFVGPTAGWLLDWAFLINWGTGTLLLNLWAVMCYFSLFTRRVWGDIIFGEPVAGANMNNNNDANDMPRQLFNDGADGAPAENDAAGSPSGRTGPAWQGRDGVVARCVASIKAFVVGWEWDKIDRQALLSDFAVPVAKHLGIAFVFPVSVLFLAASFLSALGRSIGANFAFRALTVLGLAIDYVLTCKDSLRSWYLAAHKVARDDRYLIGEILLNYGSS